MTSPLTILIVNGPNLSLLGTREPEVYGTESLDQILSAVTRRAGELQTRISHFQSECEGELLRHIHAETPGADGWIFNPAAYTHTSVALRDAIAACAAPCVEVHLSNLYRRETFRQVSLTAASCLGVVSGFGGFGYILALEALVRHLRNPG